MAAEAKAARNEKDDARAVEAETWERERIAKCRAEKSRLALRIAEEKVYKYRVALIMSWIVLGVYFVFWGPWIDATMPAISLFAVTFTIFDAISMPCFIKLYI